MLSPANFIDFRNLQTSIRAVMKPKKKKNYNNNNNHIEIHNCQNTEKKVKTARTKAPLLTSDFR